MQSFLRKIKAFGLIEVLISTVIMGTALMALASLQIQAIKGVKEASRQSIAVMIAEDIANRLLANKPELARKELSEYVKTTALTSDLTKNGILKYASESVIKKCGPGEIEGTVSSSPVCDCIGSYQITLNSDGTRFKTENIMSKNAAINDLVRIGTLLEDYLVNDSFKANADIKYINNLFVITVKWEITNFTGSSTPETAVYKLFI